jgi:hypothetical protein
MKPFFAKTLAAADINSCFVASPFVELRRFTIFTYTHEIYLAENPLLPEKAARGRTLSRVRSLRQSCGGAILAMTSYLLIDRRQVPMGAAGTLEGAKGDSMRNIRSGGFGRPRSGG